MRILILGGTGAMGVPLVKILSEKNEIVVTSRSKKNSDGNVQYVQGDAHDIVFLKKILALEYDIIIDFMIYSTEELKERISLLLDNCNQYIFFSSSRVYAESKEPLVEMSKRLLDICKDEKYLHTDEYALSKAREENIIIQTKKNNWTIIRPYITYNSHRIQLGVYEKENWLYRALNGNTIVFPKDIADRATSLTYGPDIAKIVAMLIDNPEAYGQVFHIVNPEIKTWGEVLNIYLSVIERKTGIKCKVMYPENSDELMKVWPVAQIKYDRLYDRIFDSSKVETICKHVQFLSIEEGVEKCLTEFLNDKKWLRYNVKYEAWADKYAKEVSALETIPSLKNKLKYLKYRFFVR